MCYTFLNTENRLGPRAKIGKGRDGPRLARSLIIFQEFSNFPFSNVLPTARLFIYCSTSRCLTLYHDFQPRCKRHKPLSKKKPRMKDRGKKERKKKNFLPGKIPDNSANKCFKRPRAPFNYSTGIQQFPVLSPSFLNLHGGLLPQKTGNGHFRPNLSRWVARERAYSSFRLDHGASTLGKSSFSSGATQWPPGTCWPRKINGPIYEASNVRLIKSQLCRYVFLGRSTILLRKEVITRDGC